MAVGNYVLRSQTVRDTSRVAVGNLTVIGDEEELVVGTDGVVESCLYRAGRGH